MTELGPTTSAEALVNLVGSEITATDNETGEMESASSVMGLLDLPDVVVDHHLIKYLDLPTMQSLRLLCFNTKNWIENYADFFQKCTVEVNPSSQMMHLLISERCSKFNLEFDTREKFQKFIQKYGRHVQELFLPLPIAQHYDLGQIQTLGLFQICHQLSSLHFTRAWPLREFNSHVQWQSEGVKNIRNLSFSISCGSYLTADDFEEFGHFLKLFRNVRTLRIDIKCLSESNLSNRNHQLLHRQVVSYVNSRCKNLTSTSYQEEAIDDFAYNLDSYVFPTIAKFCAFAMCVEYNFRDVEKACNWETFEEDFLSRVKVLHTAARYDANDPEQSPRVTFPLNKLTNIKELGIHMKHFQWDNVEILFESLKNLHLHLESDRELHDLRRATKVFGVEDNQIDTITLQLPMSYKYYNTLLEAIGVRFIQSFPHLSCLTLMNRIFPRWISVKKCQRLVVNNWLFPDQKVVEVDLDDLDESENELYRSYLYFNSGYSSERPPYMRGSRFRNV